MKISHSSGPIQLSPKEVALCDNLASMEVGEHNVVSLDMDAETVELLVKFLTTRTIREKNPSMFDNTSIEDIEKNFDQFYAFGKSLEPNQRISLVRAALEVGCKALIHFIAVFELSVIDGKTRAEVEAMYALSPNDRVAANATIERSQ